MTGDRSFFVSEDGSSTPTTTATLGHTEFRCHECGHPWRFGQSTCSKCNSHVFDELVIAPSVIERVGGKIRAVVVPAKPKSPPPSAAQVTALRGLQGAVANLLAGLHTLDEQLRAAVRADCEALLPAQALVNTALSISGDRSVQRIPGLSLGLESFGAGLDAILKNLDEEPK